MRLVARTHNAERRMPAMRPSQEAVGSMTAMQLAHVREINSLPIPLWAKRLCFAVPGSDQNAQRWALLTRKSRNACTRATDFNSSG